MFFLTMDQLLANIQLVKDFNTYYNGKFKADISCPDYDDLYAYEVTWENGFVNYIGINADGQISIRMFLMVRSLVAYEYSFMNFIKALDRCTYFLERENAY